MSELSEEDFENHRNADKGERFIAEDTGGREYTGTVIGIEGATVVGISSTGKQLWFRRVRDGGTPVIVMAVDGVEITEEERRERIEKVSDNKSIRKVSESGSLSFDERIVRFSVEREEITIG